MPSRYVLFQLIFRSNILRAFAYFSQKFVSSPGVQNFLDTIWKSKLAGNGLLRIVVAVVFPFLIFTIQFDEEENEIKGERCAVENRKGIRNYTYLA